MVRVIENTSSSGDNGINNANGVEVQVKKSTEAWPAAMAAMKLQDNQWLTPKLSREGGDVHPASNAYDIANKIVADGNVNTLNFRISQAVVDYSYLKISDIQMGLRIWFR